MLQFLLVAHTTNILSYHFQKLLIIRYINYNLKSKTQIPVITIA